MHRLPTLAHGDNRRLLLKVIAAFHQQRKDAQVKVVYKTHIKEVVRLCHLLLARLGIRAEATKENAEAWPPAGSGRGRCEKYYAVLKDAVIYAVQLLTSTRSYDSLVTLSALVAQQVPPHPGCVPTDPQQAAMGAVAQGFNQIAASLDKAHVEHTNSSRPCKTARTAVALRKSALCMLASTIPWDKFQRWPPHAARAHPVGRAQVSACVSHMLTRTARPAA